jgi:Electron transfer DM13
MKPSSLTLLGLASILTLSSQIAFSATQPRVNSVVQPNQNIVAQASPSSTIASGSFVAAEQPTQGTFRIVAENRQRYLELGQTFKTNNGPDLHVILYRTDAPPQSGLRRQDYISLGRLQKVNGTQRYAIPGNVNLANFHSAAIWCRRFNATFGYGKLGR